jgi:hypothetical protein
VRGHGRSVEDFGGTMWCCLRAGSAISRRRSMPGVTRAAPTSRW